MGSPRGRQAAEQVVRRKPHHVVLVVQHVAPAGEDELDQTHQIRLGHQLAQALEQDRMIDRREVLADVGAQDVAMTSRELLQTVDGAVRALADPVGVAVRDEHPLEARLDDGAQGVVHDAVPELRRADLAALGLVDEEVGVGARAYAPRSSSCCNSSSAVGGLKVERRHRSGAPLAARGATVRLAAGWPSYTDSGTRHCAGRNQMAEELVLLTRLFDLLAWLLPKSEKFPRSYRFTVTQRMMDAALDCQEAVLSAQSQRGDTRRVALRAADADLNRLRLYLRLAHHWHWLNDSQYQHVSAQVAEIGRLLGGWIKQSGS